MVPSRLVSASLVLALTLAPALGRAQSSGDAPVDVPAEVTPPPLMPVEAAPEPSPAPAATDAPRAWGPEARRAPSVPTAARGALEILGGGVTATVAGFGAALALSAASDCNNDFDDDCIVAVVFGGMGGAVLGLPLGVYGVGRMLGVEGGLGAAYLGMLAGGGIGLLGALAFQDREDGNAFLAVPAGALLGSAILFELSDRGPVPDAGSRLHSEGDLRLVPMVGPTRHGGLMGGLSARF